MKDKFTRRTILGIAAIVLLFLGWQWFDRWSQDPENESQVNTAGFIAALDESSKTAAVFDSNGNEVKPPAAPAGREDREVSWGPTGAHVFISSNRETEGFNVHRWNPVNGSLRARSQGSRNQSAPSFYPDGSVESLREGLVVGGGTVQVFDPKKVRLQQILPPLDKGRATGDEGGGMVGSMSGAFAEIGSSFKEAEWGPEKKAIFAVMRRERGEVLVLNALEADAQGRTPPPIPLAAADRILLDSQPGGMLAGVVGFQWPDPAAIPEQFLKDGVPQKPYENSVLFMPSLDAPPQTLPPFPDGQFAAELALSPDGTRAAFVLARKVDDTVEKLGLLIVSLDGSAPPVPIDRGVISQPSFSPDGLRVVYIKADGEDRAIFTSSASSSSPRRVSPSGRSFRSPVFSPQTQG
ncbi:MAG: hypothetical protein MH204_06935 [Fimbriimonadaceae bacterium]|nr:hypothetical protein [Fimbriimonadaceae bacterium]